MKCRPAIGGASTRSKSLAISRLAVQGRALLLAAVAAAVLPAGSAAASGYSDLWGKDGELWDPTKLPDFSYAGGKPACRVAASQGGDLGPGGALALPGTPLSMCLLLSVAHPSCPVPVLLKCLPSF